MRHLIKGSKLGRTASHRKATLSALAVALIHEQRITTTVVKAKELRRYIEPLITRSKVDSTHNRRQVFAKLQDKYAVTELFEEVGPLAKDRPGGYTRVLKQGFRVGDAAELAVIELVDFNDTPPETQEGKKKRTRRAGKSSKSTAGTPAAKKEEKTQEQAISDKPEAGKAQEQEVSGKAEGEGAEKETVERDSVKEPTSESEDTSDRNEESVKATSPEADEEQKDPKRESESDKDEKSEDFTVDEVKQKLDELTVEEARKFAGEDDRVTVQKALNKKIEDAS